MAWRLGPWSFGGDQQGVARRSGMGDVDDFQGPGGYGYEQGQSSYALTGTPMVFICVSRIVRRLKTFPRKVVWEKDGSEVTRKPVWVDNPNPLMSGSDMVSAMGISLLLEGEAFPFPLRDSSQRVAGVAVGNPLLIRAETYGGKVDWYWNGLRTTAEFIHVRDLTYPGRLRGLRRLTPLDKLVRISTGSLRYTQQHLDRGGAYQIVFTGKTAGRGTQSEEAREALDKMIKRYHRGWRNAYNPLILPPDIEVKSLDPKLLNADGGFLDLKQVTDAQIAQAFGIDAFEVGIAVPGSSRTYVNEPARVHKFYSDAVEPIQHAIEEGLSQLLPMGQKLVLDERGYLEAGIHDRSSRAEKLALTEKHRGERLFTSEEIRKTAGFYGPPPEDIEQPKPKMAPLPPKADDNKDDSNNNGDDDTDGGDEDAE